MGGHGAVLFEYLDFAFCLCGAYRMGHRSSGIVQRKPGLDPTRLANSSIPVVRGRSGAATRKGLSLGCTLGEGVMDGSITSLF